MTKADIVSKISEKLGIEKGDVQATVETFMEEVKSSLEGGDNVYYDADTNLESSKKLLTDAFEISAEKVEDRKVILEIHSVNI